MAAGGLSDISAHSSCCSIEETLPAPLLSCMQDLHRDAEIARSLGQAAKSHGCKSPLTFFCKSDQFISAAAPYDLSMPPFLEVTEPSSLRFRR